MAITAKQNEDLQKQYDLLRSQGLSTEQATAQIKGGLQKTVVENPTAGTGASAFDTLKSSFKTGGVEGGWIGAGRAPTSDAGVIIPTVATTNKPLVDKETIGIKTPEPVQLTRDNFVSILSKDPTKLTEQDKELIRKVQARRNLGEDLGTIFGETPTVGTGVPVPTAPLTTDDITKKKGELATQTADLVTKKQQELDANLSKRKSELEALGEKQKQAAQTVLSTSGFGRSTTAATQMDTIQKSINDMVAAEQARASQELAIYKAQQEGADSETIGKMQETLNKYNDNVKKLEFETATETAKLNAANKIKGKEALDSFMATLTGTTKASLDAGGYNEKLSSKLGYAVDKFGKPLIVDGKKLEFTGEAGVSDAVESYASEIFKGNANISSVPDDKRDAVINRVAGMRSENKTSTSSVNEFKAEKILKTILKRQIDKQKDAAYMGFVSNMLDKGYSEDQIYSELGSADLKKTDFVAGNQKLFDDMQKDTKNFSDIKGSYTNINAIVKDAIGSKSEQSKASADQALITLFNKMLDPGSVVREGEYDRTTQGQSVLAQATGYLNRLTQGGAPITDDARKDMVRIAGILYKQAENGIKIRKDTYGQIASDVGGDPDFVNRYFDGQIVKNSQGSQIDTEERDQISSIFGGGTGSQEFKSSSGKSFKLNFNMPGQSGSTTKLPDLTKERGKSIPYTGNVGKDLNNPGNLTAGGGADKFASGYVTVTGRDGVTRKFLTFDSKDAGYEGVKQDLQAKISGGSRYVKPTDTLGKLLDVWVGGKGAGAGYKGIVQTASGYTLDTPVRGLDVNKILKGIKIAEGA